MSKKISLTFILISLGISLVQAQLFIPKGGIAFSKTTGSLNLYGTVTEFQNLTGYSAGFGFEFKLPKRYNLLIEGFYVKKGWKLNYDGVPPGDFFREVFDQTNVFNYIDFPVLIKRYFGQSWLKFYVNGGSYISIGVGGISKIEDTSYDRSNGGVVGYYKSEGKVTYGNQPDNYIGGDKFVKHRLDYGVAFGGGVLIFNRIMVDARYEMGMTNLMENYGDNKMRSIQLSIAVPINLGDK